MLKAESLLRWPSLGKNTFIAVEMMGTGITLAILLSI